MNRREVISVATAVAAELWVSRAKALLRLGGGGVAVVQVATPTFSPAGGSYSSAQTVTITCSTPGSSIYYTTDGSTPTYPVTGTTQLYTGPLTVSFTETINVIGVETGLLTSAEGSASYTITASSSQLYPRFGIQAISTLGGNQLPNNTTMNQAAQYPFVILGEGGQVGGSYLTRSQVVSGLKGQTLTGKNAILPIVYQYDDLTFLSSFYRPGWSTQCAAGAANWLLYLTGSSGTLAGGASSSNAYTDPAEAAGTSGGLYPYQWGAEYMNDRYFANGPKNDMTFSSWGASNLDGFFLDNTSAYANTAGDYTRTGSTSGTFGSTGATTVSARTIGMALAPSQMASINPGKGVSGNTAYGYSTAVYGFSASAFVGAFSYPMQQWMFGRTASSIMATFSFSTVLQIYQNHESSCATGTNGIYTGGYLSGDQNMMRHDVCFLLVFGNGYHIAGWQGDQSYGDTVDASVITTLPTCDEYYGGQQGVAGFLGTPIDGPQTTPWKGNIYRRRFTYGTVYFNAGTTTTSSYSLGGGTYYQLRGVSGNGESINNAAGITSLSLGTITYTNSHYSNPTMGDACILMNSAT